MKLDRMNPNSSIYDNNFSTTTKSKFNTIDQYNNRSNSRNNSPSKERPLNALAGGNSDTGFNMKDCTIYSNVDPPQNIDEEESIKEEINMEGSFHGTKYNKDDGKVKPPIVTPGTI